MRKLKYWIAAAIGLAVIVSLTLFWSLANQIDSEPTPETTAETTSERPVTSTEQLKLMLPAESLSILDQAPLTGLEDISATWVSSNIELDLN
ncbi:hypothetical protein AUK40_01645 [Candidatus Wirthbacteria bacterium CG2_30_54_11]|uniref:Uncharacterized protein n=1 Tax=Candidatus Wirthbacteria bacterium CG2_30_54_11 TaxID=1817892 RepID=A0A1J5IMT8_9BACT|nr:MAG: hypothetical protein AUK40_01645 [Candidatus Wirthbacteria bacterium CG2_30_54_11]